MEDVIVLDELKKDIESTKKSIDSIIDKLNYLEPLITETHTASMDIYYGTYVTEWIEDLKKNGTSSETYKTPLRMEYLATYPDAVNNTTSVSGTTVEQIIFDYAIENNLNIGEYFKARDYPSTLQYHNAKTIDDIITNTTWFDLLCQSINRNRPVFKNNNCLTKVFDNIETLGTILKNRLTAIQKSTRYLYVYKDDTTPKVRFNGLALVTTVRMIANGHSTYSIKANVTMLDGSVQVIDGYSYSLSNQGGVLSLTLNDYITKIEIIEFSGTADGINSGIRMEGLIKP